MSTTDILGSTKLLGTRINDFTAIDGTGKKIAPVNLQKKITFINFWFASCTPCIAEFAALQKLYLNNREKENFQFISITYEPDSTIKKIKKKYNLTFPIYHLSEENCRKVLVGSGYPCNMIVEKDLKIVRVLSGGAADTETADELLNKWVQSDLHSIVESIQTVSNK